MKSTFKIIGRNGLYMPTWIQAALLDSGTLHRAESHLWRMVIPEA
jgi:hypothetical protein